MFIVVGLGNPGQAYEQTRHNVGFRVVDDLERISLKSPKPARGRAIFVKPPTFMNRSGEAVKKVIEEYRYGDKLDRLWVIHDDLDLPVGTVRVKLGGSSAGHKGVQSIIEALGSDQFWRIRLGIGHPSTSEAEEYVLSAFSPREKPVIDQVIEQTAQRILQYLSQGEIIQQTTRVKS